MGGESEIAVLENGESVVISSLTLSGLVFYIFIILFIVPLLASYRSFLSIVVYCFFLTVLQQFEGMTFNNFLRGGLLQGLFLSLQLPQILNVPLFQVGAGNWCAGSGSIVPGMNNTI